MTLIEELRTGDYTGLTNQQIADSLNNTLVNKVRAIPLLEFLAWYAQSSPTQSPRITKVKLAITTGATDQIKAFAEAMDLLLRLGLPELNASESKLLALINALVSANVLSNEDKQAFIDLATIQVSKASTLGFTTITAADIAFAKAQMGEYNA